MIDPEVQRMANVVAHYTHAYMLEYERSVKVFDSTDLIIKLAKHLRALLWNNHFVKARVDVSVKHAIEHKQGSEVDTYIVISYPGIYFLLVGHADLEYNFSLGATHG